MTYFVNFLSEGLLNLSWWQLLLYTLAVTHITIAGVTIFLHRSQAHRGLDLHPVVMHFFRFWLWMTTGMVTKEWVAIHRKHHAKCEREGDPHSPMVFGIKKVFFEGAELYRSEASNQETLDRYGHGTPDDWMERNVYSRHSGLGITLMLLINFSLFGVIGVSIWAIQMMWIPFWAAGVVNGIGHFWGYRNFSSPDTSRNIFPIGIIIGGEELHNNHHAYGTSAKFASKWYEFDLGWWYIKLLSCLGLAKVKKVAPELKLDVRSELTMQTLNAVITHRYEVMSNYAKMIKKACREELKNISNREEKRHLKRLPKWLQRSDANYLSHEDQVNFDNTVSKHEVLEKMMNMRAELFKIWERSTSSSEQLLSDLQKWAEKAQSSGNQYLIEFSQRLRQYVR